MATATVAADAPPRSSSAADTYIGSLISLTSKSEIRYEGVLFNINTEESSIGLKNVRSFGTEGRKKDGPQVPPSNKIYEYILFRGSDIKDLQVKSSQPAPPAAPIHDDPAIIQSHYPPQGATSSASLPYPGIRPAPDLSSQIPQGGVPRPSFQGSLPLYQPGRSTVGSWGPSPTPTTMDASGLAMPPTYWQGYYGPTNDLQAQQQALLRPPLGVGMSMPPPSMPPPSMQYPVVNNSLVTGASNSQFSEYNPSFIPTMNSGSLANVSDISTNLIPDPLALDKSAIPPPISEKPQIVPDPVMPFSSLSDSMSSLANSVLNEGPMPSLVTPGQLLQPGPSTLQSFSQTAQKDVEVVQVSSSESALATSIPAEPVVEAVELDERVQPLPSQADQRPYQQNRYPMNSYQNNRRGRGRGRGNEISRSATRFTEDFDFTAMNEKFNKDEVWGHLGKGNEAEENGKDVDGAGTSKLDAKPVYVKDDFFDSLSCDALGGGSRNRRPNYSEQSRRDNEGYGEFSRYRGGRGYGGGQSRGGYYGRGGGYGHNGRGRGGYGMYGHGGESY